MKLQMHENSLFAVLLRSPWWLSMLVALGTGAASRFVLVKFDFPQLYALFIALPFLVIGSVAGWRQLRAPSADRIAADIDRLRALSWDEFAAALEAGWRRQGYEVKRIGGAADFELGKSGRVTLAACKRWKAVRTGIEPLRELDALRRKREADEALYVAAGEVTETARAFAAQSGIRLVDGAGAIALL